MAQLLLHGVSDAADGGVVLRIQDVGGRGRGRQGHQLGVGDLVAHPHRKQDDVLGLVRKG